MKTSIYTKQSLNFWIIIKQSSYRPIGLRNNIIYCIFIVDRLYEDQKRNVHTQFHSFGIFVILWTVFIVNVSMYQTECLFFLHSIIIYVNNQTIDLTQYDIIIYMI